MPSATLEQLNEQLLRTPEDFTVHPKLARQLERRRGAMTGGGIDWGHAEALAFASLLVEGIPIRLTGQDVQRGTFAQRHLVLHDVHTGETFTPMQHLDDASASFEVFNSPLSEYACLGFEYGYSAAAPEALVLWEAQYGDFANGAQIVIDQFISSGLVQVARDVAADAAAAARVRGQRARALERAARAVPAARARRRTCASRTARPPRSTSTCCGGRRSTRRRARSWSSRRRAFCASRTRRRRSASSSAAASAR